MPISSFKLPLLIAAGFAAAIASQAPAFAADPVRGYYAEPPRRVHVYREHSRVVRTTYVRRVEECQLLTITEPGVVKYANICFKPLDLRP